MTGFSMDDRHRSLRRFVMNSLGAPPWRVRTERQPVPDDDRPVAVVEATSAVTTTFARTSIPQGDVQRAQSFTITMYPVLEASAAESRLAAETVAEALSAAITFGLIDDEDPPGNLTAPDHLPVYDFAGVDVKGTLRAGPDEHYGWMSIEDAAVRTIQDPEDPLRWTVVCELRLTWWQGGRLGQGGPLAGSLEPHPQWPQQSHAPPIGEGTIEP